MKKDREKHYRPIHTQTGSKTQRLIQRYTKRQTGREKHTKDTQTLRDGDTHRDSYTNIEVGIQRQRHTSKKTNGETEYETNRHT